jgi:sporulation-specific protein 4
MTGETSEQASFKREDIDNDTLVIHESIDIHGKVHQKEGADEGIREREEHYHHREHGESQDGFEPHYREYRDHHEPRKHHNDEECVEEEVEEVIRTRRGQWVWDGEKEERRVWNVEEVEPEHYHHHDHHPHGQVVRPRWHDRHEPEVFVEDEKAIFKEGDRREREIVVEETVKPRRYRTAEELAFVDEEDAQPRRRRRGEKLIPEDDELNDQEEIIIEEKVYPRRVDRHRRHHEGPVRFVGEDEVFEEIEEEELPRHHKSRGDWKGVEEIIVEDNDEAPTSKFVEHLATYPAVAAVTGFAASFPVIKIFASNGVPLLKYIQERTSDSRTVEPVYKRIQPVVKRVDKLGDEVLTSMDNRFPQLKTAEPREVATLAQEPVRRARRAASNYRRQAGEQLSERVVRPLKSVSRAARGQYNRVYDTHGRALVRSRFDPLVLPVNDRLESFISDYLPEGEELPNQANLSNEFSRTWRLARTAANRARPVVREQVRTARSVPRATRNHVRKVYNTKAIQHTTRNRRRTAFEEALVLLGTGRQLTRDLRGNVQRGLRIGLNSRVAVQPLDTTATTTATSGILSSILQTLRLSSSGNTGSALVQVLCPWKTLTGDETDDTTEDETTVEDDTTDIVDDTTNGGTDTVDDGDEIEGDDDTEMRTVVNDGRGNNIAVFGNLVEKA